MSPTFNSRAALVLQHTLKSKVKLVFTSLTHNLYFPAYTVYPHEVCAWQGAPVDSLALYLSSMIGWQHRLSGCLGSIQHIGFELPPDPNQSVYDQVILHQKTTEICEA